MTKVILNIDESSRLMFDCINHSDDHDVCTIVSTLCNVLVAEADRIDIEPTVYNKGHVRIDIPFADQITQIVFQDVMRCIQEAEHQNPQYLRVY